MSKFVSSNFEVKKNSFEKLGFKKSEKLEQKNVEVKKLGNFFVKLTNILFLLLRVPVGHVARLIFMPEPNSSKH